MTAEEQFRLWAARLLPASWELNIVADRSLTGNYAETETIPANRRATIHYNPEHSLSPATACHEVCHVLLSHLERAGQAIADGLPEGERRLAQDMIRHESEETAVMLADAFLRLEAANPVMEVEG
jgi:hypothetical protein